MIPLASVSVGTRRDSASSLLSSPLPLVIFSCLMDDVHGLYDGYTPACFFATTFLTTRACVPQLDVGRQQHPMGTEVETTGTYGGTHDEETRHDSPGLDLEDATNETLFFHKGRFVRSIDRSKNIHLASQTHSWPTAVVADTGCRQERGVLLPGPRRGLGSRGDGLGADLYGAIIHSKITPLSTGGNWVACLPAHSPSVPVLPISPSAWTLRLPAFLLARPCNRQLVSRTPRTGLLLRQDPLPDFDTCHPPDIAC